MTDKTIIYGQKRIENRQIDELIGIVKGLTASGSIDCCEAQFFLDWLLQNEAILLHPFIQSLRTKVTDILATGTFSEEELKGLYDLLKDFPGGETVFGEAFRSSMLPVFYPASEIFFKEKVFCFSGTFSFGLRKDCHSATESLGGLCAKYVTQNVDYLVIGLYATDSWRHETFGRKILAATKQQESGAKIKIVAEEDWLTAMKEHGHKGS